MSAQRGLGKVETKFLCTKHVFVPTMLWASHSTFNHVELRG